MDISFLILCFKYLDDPRTIVLPECLANSMISYKWRLLNESTSFAGSSKKTTLGFPTIDRAVLNKRLLLFEYKSHFTCWSSSKPGKNLKMKNIFTIINRYQTFEFAYQWMISIHRLSIQRFWFLSMKLSILAFAYRWIYRVKGKFEDNIQSKNSTIMQVFLRLVIYVLPIQR